MIAHIFSSSLRIAFAGFDKHRFMFDWSSRMRAGELR